MKNEIEDLMGHKPLDFGVLFAQRLGRGGRLFQEPADDLKKGMKVLIVAFNPLLQFVKFFKNILVTSEHFSNLIESAHHKYAYLNRSFGAKNARNHDCPMFREDMGEMSAEASHRWYRILRYQYFRLILRQTKGKIFRKTLSISFNLLPEPDGFHSVQVGQVPVQHHLLPPDNEDFVLNSFLTHKLFAHKFLLLLSLLRV